jgi:hypothetical protein
MSDRQFERAVNDWFEDGTDRAPDHAIDGVMLAIRTTPQERDLRIPWRLPMPAYARAFAVVALVVLVGAGGFIYLNNQAPSGIGAAPSPSPTASPTPAPSEVAPGITGWVPYTSDVYGYTLSYPAGWDASPANRAWKVGDVSDVNGTSDVFVNPANDVGFGVSLAPVESGTDIESVEGLKAFAQTYCTDMKFKSCGTFTDRTVPLCVDAGGVSCRPGILVRSAGTNPEDEGEYAFFPDWRTGTQPDNIVVFGVGRGDAYAGAVQYGGAVELLRSVLSTMGVTPAP